MVVSSEFWKNKNVFITGHTGFKGSWLALWLSSLGAKVTGFALPPLSDHGLFNVAHLEKSITHQLGDIRDSLELSTAIKKTQPEIVFHLAAQPLVRYSYHHPLETYTTNVIGCVNLFEAIKQQDTVKVIINVTSDKCYENKEWMWGYRENDNLGGLDPYSNSKACSELVTNAYRHSYFASRKINIATVRAGNVIGGGDWSLDRLIPDMMRAYFNKTSLNLRYPEATRPWQFVLEPIAGYLLLAEKLYHGEKNADSAWNFGPEESDVETVQWVINRMQKWLNNAVKIHIDDTITYHEAQSLQLDCSKAKSQLMWRPKWNLEKCLEETALWYMAHAEKRDMYTFSLEQLNRYSIS